jgi:hypothetical protein
MSPDSDSLSAKRVNQTVVSEGMKNGLQIDECTELPSNSILTGASR